MIGKRLQTLNPDTGAALTALLQQINVLQDAIEQLERKMTRELDTEHNERVTAEAALDQRITALETEEA